VRITLERAVGPPPWRYEGALVTPDGEHAIGAIVEASGEVRVEIAPGAPEDASERVRLLLRTVYKQATLDGVSAPARRVVRWRAAR
jgi:hypothetical protein